MILVYHHVCPEDQVPLNPEIRFNNGWEYRITPEDFDYHISFFLRKGFSFVSMGDYLRTLTEKGRESRRDIVISFDDGWLDNYQYAYTILKKYKVPAIIFVTIDGLTNTDPAFFKISQAKEMRENGTEIGSHTCHHTILTRTDNETAWNELVDSKTELESQLGIPVDFLAYPGGAFNQSIVDMTREAGYKAACSILSPAVNTKNDLFWLFRNVFTDRINTLPDYYRSSPLMTRLLEFRVRKRLKEKLDSRLQGSDT